MSVSFEFELGYRLDFSPIKLKRTNAKMNFKGQFWRKFEVQRSLEERLLFPF